MQTRSEDEHDGSSSNDEEGLDKWAKSNWLEGWLQLKDSTIGPVLKWKEEGRSVDFWKCIEVHKGLLYLTVASEVLTKRKCYNTS